MRHRQLILIDVISRQNHYRTFTNMMLMEIGNVMIATFSGKEQDRSFPL